MTGRVLVAGIGNIFLGDDAFGVEVVNRLRRGPLPESVEVADFGIRGLHLAYELADGKWDAAILVDAMPRGGPPGTLYAIEPELEPDDPPLAVPDAHGLTPAAVLALLRQTGTGCRRIIVVGCEPATVEESMALSPPVAAAVDEAMRMVLDLVAGMRSETPCA